MPQPLRGLAVLTLSAHAIAACGAPAPPVHAEATPPAMTAAPSVTAAPPPTSAATSVAASDAAAPAEPSGPLPAGLCSFAGYLSFHPACEGVPPMTHAVLLDEVRGRAAAEALIAAWVGKLTPGYPMVLAQSELPLDAEDHAAPEGLRDVLPGALLGDSVRPPRTKRGTLRVVAGFFASAGAARKFAAEVLQGAGSVHSIAGSPPSGPESGDYQAFMRTQGVAVAIAHPAPAYGPADLDKIEAKIAKRKSGEDEDALWESALAKAAPACSVRAGQVFESDRDTLYQRGRRFAPVECEGGRPAWTAWTATRLESVVRVEKDGVFFYQIVDVMCDMASIDRTPFVWASPLAKGPRAHAGCGRGRS